MDSDKVLGLIIIILAYSTTWLLLIKSLKIIKGLHKKNLRSIDEIQEELGLKGRELDE